MMRIERLLAACRRSCPAASSSASRLPARWSRRRRSCCSTSRWSTSTTSCARSCAARSARSSATAPRPWSTRRPSRRKRCCSAATRSCWTPGACCRAARRWTSIAVRRRSGWPKCSATRRSIWCAPASARRNAACRPASPFRWRRICARCRRATTGWACAPTTSASPQRAGNGGVIRATVELAEINGSETYVHARHSDFTLIALLEGVHEFALGEEINLHLDPDRLFVFDGAGGLAAAAAQAGQSRGSALMARIEFKDIKHSYLPRAGGAGGLCAAADASGLAGRRRLCAARTVRLRQDDAAQHHFRIAAPERRQRAVRRPRRDRPVAGRAQHRAGFPVSGHLRHHDRVRQSGVSAAQPRRSRKRKCAAASRKWRRCWSSAPTSSGARAGLPPTPSRRSRSAAGWCARTSPPSCSTSRSPSSTRTSNGGCGASSRRSTSATS